MFQAMNFHRFQLSTDRQTRASCRHRSRSSQRRRGATARDDRLNQPPATHPETTAHRDRAPADGRVSSLLACLRLGLYYNCLRPGTPVHRSMAALATAAPIWRVRLSRRRCAASSFRARGRLAPAGILAVKFVRAVMHS